MTSDGSSTTTDTAASSSGGTTEGGSTTSGRELCPFVFDDFEDGIIAPGWTLSSAANVAESGGELVLTITPMVGDFVSARRDGLDLSAATVTVELGMPVGVEGAQVLLNAFTPKDDRLLMLIHNDTISLRRGFPGNPSLQVLQDAPFDPALDRWARFEIRNQVLSFQTSENGDSWTTLLDQPYDWDYSVASFGLSASNFVVLPAPETPSFRSFEVCLDVAP